MIDFRKFYPVLIPGSIVLIHLLLKLLTASSMNIWGDEAFSIFYSQQALTDLNKMFVNELNPPLYFYLLHFWIKLFGVGVLGVKSLSIVFSSLSALLIYKIGKLIQGNETALLASSFFLLSNLHFDFSHEVRPYSLVCLESLLSFYFFISYIKNRKRKSLMGLIIVNACIAYTHYVAIFIPVIQFLIVWFFLTEKKERQQILAAYVLSGLLFAPYLLIMLGTVPNEDFWLKSPNLGFLEYVILKLVGNDGWAMYLLIPFTIAPIFFLPKLRPFLFKKEFNVKEFTLFYVWFFAPIFIDFIVAQYVPIFRLRYILSSSLGLYIGFSYLIWNIRLPNLLLYGIMSLYFLSFLQYFKAEKRCGQHWDNTARLLSGHESESTISILSAGYKLADLAYYYDRSIFQDYQNINKRMKEKGVFPMLNASDLSSISDLDRYEKVNLILSHNNITDPDNTLEEYFNSQKYELCDDFNSFVSPRFMVFSKQGSDCRKFSPIKSDVVVNNCSKWTKTLYNDLQSNSKVTSYQLLTELVKGCNYYVLDEREPPPKFVVSDKSPNSPALNLPCDNYFKIVIKGRINGNKTKEAVFAYVHSSNEEMLEFMTFQLSNDSINSDLSEDSYSYAPNHEHKENCSIKIFLFNSSDTKIYLEDFAIELWQ